MRLLFLILLPVLIMALGICIYAAKSSKNPNGKSVALFISTLIIPIAANLFLIASSSETLSLITYYIYFIGMDAATVGLFIYSINYCEVKKDDKKLKIFKPIIYGILILDIIQLLLNILTHHSFEVESIIIDSLFYFQIVQHFGLTIHRIVCYGIILGIAVLFLHKSIKSSRISSEKYWIILLSMFFVGVWGAIYIIFNLPINSSMIGLGIFGLLVFYFTLYYHPFRLLDKLLASIAVEVSEALYFFDKDNQCLWANKPGLKLVMMNNKDYDHIPLRLKKIFPDIDLDENNWLDKRSIQEINSVSYYTLEKRLVKDERNKVLGSFLRAVNITEQENDFREQKYNATHDRMTGLYNKETFYEQVKKLINQDIEHHYLAIYFDIADFKMVNDAFGAEFGDYILKEVANRIRSLDIEHLVYGRLGGDNFGICVRKDLFDVEYFEKELINFEITKDDNTNYKLLVYLGIYEIVNRNLDVSIMFDRGKLSLESIKSDYIVHIAYYDDSIRKQTLTQRRIISSLNESLEKGYIFPYLQSIVDRDGKIVGCEALVRWKHPDNGFMTPDTFIPALEANGMISVLDKFMWRKACEILDSWKDTHPELFISINISTRDFYYLDIEKELKNLVEEFNIHPSKLRIEITETVMMNDLNRGLAVLYNLRQAGFLIEMDDFGSGYSSLNMLKDLPVNIVKFDMKFISDIKDPVRVSIIMESIINLASQLEIISLSEGVETELQFNKLKELGCMYFQGYYFSKPIPVDEFEKLLDNND